MELCIECSKIFFHNQVNVFIISVSILLSLISLFLLNRKNLSLRAKQYLIYSHIFFLVFPFAYYLFFNGCNALFSHCDKTRAILIMVILSALIAFLAGIIVMPLLFLRRITSRTRLNTNKSISNFVSDVSNEISIRKPSLFVLNDIRPLAFAYIKSSIFISTGLINLLSNKELEAVLLHEINHAKNSSSWFKLSTLFLKVSPIATFITFIEDINKEELESDNFAIVYQKTDKYIKNARRKIKESFFMSI
ncbi:MAG: M48 family metalloprotease [Nanoarchaeota archaeon]